MIITQSDRNFYNAQKDNYTHIISIVCPDEKEIVEPIHDKHYIAKMWDIDKPLKNKFRTYNPPSFLEVNSAIVWACKRWEEAVRNNEFYKLLIHCDAGISRSPAILLGILWKMSELVFNEYPKEWIMKSYLEARKQWCISYLDWNNSIALKRFIEGRLNPGIKPNQAILQIFRKELSYFPW